jgi:cinnamoyl-CoA reductase
VFNGLKLRDTFNQRSQSFEFFFLISAVPSQNHFFLGPGMELRCAAVERLTMLQVDLLDRASLRAAFDGVVHTASPMHDNLVSNIAAAARPDLVYSVCSGGKFDYSQSHTQLRSVRRGGVGRRGSSPVRGTSSRPPLTARRAVLHHRYHATMYMNPHRDQTPTRPRDESSCSDLEYCKSTKVKINYFSQLSPKELAPDAPIAERSAWEAARGLDLAVVIPVVVLGELLRPGMSTSTLHILSRTSPARTYVNESHAYLCQMRLAFDIFQPE